MANKFLHLGINFSVGTSLDKAAIETKLNKAKDWLRYAPNCWIIYTGQPANIWYKRLKELPELEDKTFFVCEINLDNRAGWLQKSAWEWLKKQRE